MYHHPATKPTQRDTRHPPHKHQHLYWFFMIPHLHICASSFFTPRRDGAAFCSTRQNSGIPSYAPTSRPHINSLIILRHPRTESITTVSPPPNAGGGRRYNTLTAHAPVVQHPPPSLPYPPRFSFYVSGSWVDMGLENGLGIGNKRRGFANKSSVSAQKGLELVTMKIRNRTF